MDRQAEPNHEGLGKLAWSFVALLLLVVLACAFAIWPPWHPRRVPPTVAGTLFRVELPEAGSFFTDRLNVFAIDRDGPAIAAIEPGDLQRPRVLVVHRFPSGELLERRDPCTAADVARVEAERRSTPPSHQRFDLDGDGSLDLLVVDRGLCEGHAEIRSGADDRVLFVSDDPLEYESTDRVTFLGDLDGDGCSELAVWHPRSDRSRYDFELMDMVFGVKSWLSIVSGKLALEERRARLAEDSR
ncbi:MAG: VCBS repeat-containing protein [Planctomycetes bacterium]|nr:VCBS repeat-containing protein [Planctomycetota bacterium]